MPAVFGLDVGTGTLILGILAVIFGILIIKLGKWVVYLIGAYLIITGLLKIVGLS